MSPARNLLPALILALSLGGGAERAPALDVGSTLSQSSWSSAQKEEIQSIFAQADQAGIPRDILLPRLAEAVAKKVPFALAEGKLRNHLQNLEKARSILQSAPGGQAILEDEGAWSLSAMLLENGASEQEIVMLENAAQGKSAAYRRAGFLQASLAGWGLPRLLSLQVSLAALNSALEPDLYSGIVDVFEQGRQMRIPPERLASRVMVSLSDARDLEELRRAVLY